MRKALIVLLLLVAVIGLTFAADPEPTPIDDTTSNTITLVMLIGEKLPVFNLKASSGSVTVETNSGDNAYMFSDGASHIAVAELAIGGDISTKSISQIFEIYSDAKANYNGGFVFTVEATPFSAQDGASGTSYTTKGDRIYSYEAENTSGSNIAVEARGDRIIATFSGPQVNTGVKIGQIVVTWPRDPSAIPAEYVSDVTMRIEAN